MRMLRVLRQRARSLFRGARVDAELENELVFHVEQLTRENMASGMNAAEARIAARRALGGEAYFAEQCRDQRRIGWVLGLTKDVQYAWRMLRKSPGFSALAAITLALGVGASIAVYTLAEALLLRSLPYPQPERLVALWNVHGDEGPSVGQDNFAEWRAANTVFERMAYTGFDQTNLTGAGEPERVTGSVVSEGFFEMLGVQPRLGRWFTPEEEKPGAERVVVISHALWMRKLGGRPEAVGSTILLNERPYRVTGVMPADFRFNEGRLSEYWRPVREVAHDRRQHQYAAYARLRPGVTVRAAQAQMAEIARRQASAYPENACWTVSVQSMRNLLLAREAGDALLVFATAALIMLLVGCANVASLLLARGVGRSKEIAVRIALGAGRLRVVRMLLVESLLLAALGTLGGLGLAAWIVRLGIASAPAWLDLGAMVSVTPTVVAFVAGIGLAAGVLTGLWPALRGSHANLQDDLKEGGGSLVAGRRHHRALNGLVVAEIALAVVLLGLGGLLARSLVALIHTDLGFRTDHLLTLRLAPPSARYGTNQAQLQFWTAVLARVSAVPGVVSTAAADGIPLSGASSCDGVEIEGQSAAHDWSDAMTCMLSVTPGYFKTMGVRLHAGRLFADAEDQPDAIVNQTFVRRFLRDRDPLGKRFRFSDGKWHTVVGVIADSRYEGPAWPVRPEVYTSSFRDPWLEFVVLRTAVPEATLVSAVRRAIREVDANIPLTDVRSMRQSIDQRTVLEKVMTTLVGVFASITLGMATLGLAGVLAYAVSRRRREFGLRMALGARAGDVFRDVLRNAWRLIAIGSAIGFAGTYFASNVLAAFLYSVRPHDPLVLAAAPLLLALIGALACLAPARRAASIEPMAALRQE